MSLHAQYINTIKAKQTYSKIGLIGYLVFSVKCGGGGDPKLTPNWIGIVTAEV